eukprot:CAMPEP_0119357256 /NCGR_PEP_ID=MMETSP1334-20130426/5687_1 /TAXON_ID=127549 /ORGANISM="Calcidiscus leptoporus, Strain RCC1130" /LENGTH=47 /DNA_ID= /DNA_START= /DNA_END= /DNA_ORIENTATION=
MNTNSHELGAAPPEAARGGAVAAVHADVHAAERAAAGSRGVGAQGEI